MNKERTPNLDGKTSVNCISADKNQNEKTIPFDGTRRCFRFNNGRGLLYRIVLFLFISFGLFFPSFTGCVKENANTNLIHYEVDSLFLFIEKHYPSFSELQTYASHFIEYTSSSESEDRLILYFGDKGQFIYDISNEPYLEDDSQEIDTLAINHLIDSLNLAYGISIPETAENAESSKNSPYMGRTKAAEEELLSLKVLYWTPESSWYHKNGDQYEKIVKGKKGASFTRHSSPLFLPTCDQYDIVIVNCHGNPGGKMVIPYDYYKALNNLNIVGHPFSLTTKITQKTIRLILLDEAAMMKLFPQKLSSTVIWASMCYSGAPNSVFKKVCIKKDCADFFGADSVSTSQGPLSCFSTYFPLFYSGWWSSMSFSKERKLQKHFSGQAYDEQKEVYEPISYNYVRLADRDCYYGTSNATRPTVAGNKTILHSWVRTARKNSVHYAPQTKTVDGTNDKGICLENLNTGEKTWFPFSTDNYQSSTRYYDEVMFEDYQVDAGELSENTPYRYASYQTDHNGERVIVGDYVSFNTGMKEDTDPEESIRSKLIQFYYDTDGPNWKHNDNWCTDKPLSTWYGVYYSNNRYNLNLFNNNLRGKASITNEPLLNQVNLEENNLSLLDFSDCSALTILSCYNNKLTSARVGNCPSLSHFGCWDNPELSTLELINLPSLQQLSCFRCQIKNLDVSNCSSLLFLYCQDNGMEYLNVAGCNKLQLADCYNNGLSSLDFSTCTDINVINCYNNNLTNLHGCRGSVYCYNNQLETIDFSGEIGRLVCTNNKLTELDLSGHPIRWLACANNKVSSLNVSGCSFLETIICNNNIIESLDVSSCSSLEYLECQDNHIIQQIKNEDSLDYFKYDVLYSYFSRYDDYGNEVIWSEKADYGWFYPGEPEKGYHGR